MTNLYNKTRAESHQFKETNDCAVVAVALATDCPYKDVHGIMGTLGREPRSGTPWSIIKSTVHFLGFDVEITTPRKPCGGKYTSYKLPPNLDPNKRYMAVVSGHILAIINGRVEDWTQGRRCRIEQIWEVTPCLKF